MGPLLRDVRYALRSLARVPGFTAVTVVTLALGIGANTAMFSLVHAVILRPLPFRDAGRLIAVWDTYVPQFPRIGVSPAELAAWQQQTDVLVESAWYRHVPNDLDLTAPGSEALEVHATFASATLFSLLGVAPALGRAFAEHQAPDSVLLSHALWQQRFGADPAVVGKTVRLSEREFTVVGVMPAGFRFPDWADVWLPQGPLLGDELTNPVRHALGFVARLRNGVTVPAAAARLEGIAGRLAAEHPTTSTGWGVQVSGLQEDLTANIRPALLLLLGAVALVLLIACANIANLLLARASGRSKETAVRMALGAGAWSIVRPMLAESLVVAIMGGALGLALARATLAALAPVPAPLDGAVLAFLAAVCLVTGAAFGAAPALQSLRSDPLAAIQAGTPARGGIGGTRGALVVAEFALAVVLVVGAGILVKSFARLMGVHTGFDPHGVLTMRISIPPSRKPDVLFHRIEERLRPLAGVESVAAANALPLIASRANSTRFDVPGSPLINHNALPGAQIRAVSPEYFRALRIPLLAGRGFTERDLNESVVIINETFARRFWPGRDAVGMKFVTGPWGPKPTWSTIVGVVGDVKQFGLDSEPSLDLYFPSLAPRYLVVRAGGDAARLADAVRREIRGIDPGVPLSDVRTMDQVAAESARSRRWTMGLLAGFAALALLLALVGIYGVMSWAVAQRTREIGIRMALGAQTGQVMRMVLRDAVWLACLGLGIGAAAAMALRQVLAGLVFEVSTADPVTYAGAAVLMLAVALLAGYLPARRAGRVEPLTALRWE